MTRKRNSETDLGLSAGASAASSRRQNASRTRAKHVAAPETPSTTAAAEPELAATPAVVAPPAYEPSHEKVAELAYLYWEARGYQGGCPEEDWLRAEQELRVRSSASIAAIA
jgi:hypothetical protein